TSMGLQSSNDIFEFVAAGQKRWGPPVDLVAQASELVVPGINTLAGRVEDKGLANQGNGIAVQVVFTGNGSAAGCRRIGHPGIKFEKSIEIMPFVIVTRL